MSVDQEAPQAAWYVDPSSPDQIRYWDGAAWTDHVAPIDTVADLHTGHFEEVRTEERRSLGLADGPARIARQQAARAEKADTGARFDFEPPELGKGWFVAEHLDLEDEGLTTEHVVVGSAGVFVLMSRDHSDSEVWVADRSFLVDGQRTDYLRDALAISQTLTHVLKERCGFKVAVEPVIIVKAKVLTIKSQPLDAHVVASTLLGKWITRLEPVLLPSAVRTISEAVGAHKSIPTDADPAYPSIDDDGDLVDLTDKAPTAPRSFTSAPEAPASATRRSLFS